MTVNGVGSHSSNRVPSNIKGKKRLAGEVKKLKIEINKYLPKANKINLSTKVSRRQWEVRVDRAKRKGGTSPRSSKHSKIARHCFPKNNVGRNGRVRHR